MTIRAIINDIKAIHETPVYYFGSYHELDALETDDFTINIIDVLEALEPYEITESIEELTEGGYIYNDCDYKGDNSYNWLAPINHNFDFKIYDNENTADGVCYIEFKVHRFGDVRGNYTETVVLQFDSDYEFLETLSECNKYSTVEIDGNNYNVDVNIFSDGFEVFDDNGNYIATVYGYDADEITEEIRNAIVNEEDL